MPQARRRSHDSFRKDADSTEDGVSSAPEADPETEG